MLIYCVLWLMRTTLSITDVPIGLALTFDLLAWISALNVELICIWESVIMIPKAMYVGSSPATRKFFNLMRNYELLNCVTYVYVLGFVPYMVLGLIFYSSIGLSVFLAIFIGIPVVMITAILILAAVIFVYHKLHQVYKNHFKDQAVLSASILNRQPTSIENEKLKQILGIVFFQQRLIAIVTIWAMVFSASHTAITISILETQDAFSFWTLAAMEFMHIAGVSLLGTSLLIIVMYDNLVPKDLFKEMITSVYIDDNPGQRAAI